MIKNIYSLSVIDTFNEFSNPVLILDINGIILYSNLSFKTSFDIDPSLVVGKHFLDLYLAKQLSVEEQNRSKKRFGEAIKKGTVPPMDYELKREGMATLNYMTNISVIRDNKKQARYVIVSLSDISDRVKAEKQEKESQNYLRRVLDSIQAGVVLIDCESRTVLDANEAALKMLKYDKEVFLGCKCQDFLCFSEGGLCPILNEGMEVDSSERILLTSDGEDLPVIKTVSRVHIDNRECLLESFVDITERVEAEYALVQSRDELEEQVEARTIELVMAREKAQSYLDIAGVMLLAINADGIITLVNRKGCDILGYEQDDIIGKNWFETFVPPEVKSEITQVFTDITGENNNRISYHENPIVNAQGERRTIAWYNTQIIDSNGDITGTFSSGEDITEKKLMIESLQDAERRLTLSYDNAAIGMVWVSTKGKFLRSNKAFCELTGYSTNELLQMNFQDLTHPDDFQIGTDIVKKLSSGESESGIIEKRYVRKNGEIIHVRLHTVYIKDVVEGSEYFFTQAEDITDIKTSTWALGERIKEITCLYIISEITGKLGLSSEELFQRSVEVIPNAFQFPDLACARIIYGEFEATSENFRDTPWKLSSKISVSDISSGIIEVCYLEEKEEYDEGPFLKEEKELLVEIADRLARRIKRHRDQEDLQISEQRLVAFMESATDAFMLYDSDLNLIMVNTEARKALAPGIGTKDPIGMNMLELSPNIKKTGRYDEYQEVIKTGKPLINVDYIPNSKYGEVYVNLRAFKVNNGLGIITSDITKRITAEKELKLSRDIAHAFLKSDDDDLFDEILKIILENTNSKYGVFGYIDKNGANVVPSMSRHIWNECQVTDKKTIFPCQEWGNSSWPTALREKRTIVINEPSKSTPKGHVTIERHISMPLIYEDEVVGLFQVANAEGDYDEKQVKTLEDIALRVAPFLYSRLQRSRAELARDSALVQIETLNADLELRVELRTKELKDAQEELSRKERLAALGQLSASVGHELRNPLGAIKNGVYFLKMILDHPDPDVLDTLAILDQEIQNSEEIIRSLLDFTKPKEPVLQKITLNDTISAALERVEVPPNISVKTEFSSILPILIGDPHQLERAFTNLITNACQSMTDEGILSLVTTVEDNGDVIAVVTDTGVGISKENLAKMFQPLFTTKARGIGLGLSIVESIIEAHGGTIKVDSEEGIGASFIVRFPSQKNKEVAE